MKTLSLILFLILSLFTISFGQTGSLGDYNLFLIHYESQYKLDHVENEGDLSCEHSWVIKDITINSMMFCAVLHDIRGCPDTWGVEGRICRKCLRKEIWKEERKLIEPPKSEYELLDEKIGKK